MNVMPRPASAAAAVLAVVALTSACAGHHPRPEKDAAVRPPLRNAYVPDRRYATTLLQETWHDGDIDIDIALLRPASDGRFPLVVYLPDWVRRRRPERPGAKPGPRPDTRC